jgi:hypothetical protein
VNAPSIRQMADDYPGSVWQSIVNYANWTRTLDVSATTKRLTRLSGPKFYHAVMRHLAEMYVDDEQQRIINS